MLIAANVFVLTAAVC